MHKQNKCRKTKWVNKYLNNLYNKLMKKILSLLYYQQYAFFNCEERDEWLKVILIEKQLYIKC